MNVMLPPAIQGRPVFYRETSSYFFDSISFALSIVLVELPWLAFIQIITIPMVRLRGARYC
jgi:hypothetical protein